MRDIQIDRAGLAPQPSPLQLSSDATLAIVAKSSAHPLHAIDLIAEGKSSILNISAELTNVLENLVAYNEDISSTTNISDKTIMQLRWAGTRVCALTNNLNLLVLQRSGYSRSEYRQILNINKELGRYYHLSSKRILRFQDLLKLRIHSFAVRPNTTSVVIGTEAGTIAILDLSAREGETVVSEGYEAGNQSILNLDWSFPAHDTGVSYVAVQFQDNSVKLLTLRGLEIVHAQEIKTATKKKICLIRFHGNFLTIASTDLAQVYDVSTNAMSGTELGTVYATTDICFTSSDKFILTTAAGYLGYFRIDGASVVKKFSLNYNSAMDIKEKIDDDSMQAVKKALLKINSKFSRISIRGIQTDALNKMLFIAYVPNEPPMEYRRMNNSYFRVISLPLAKTLNEDEMMKFSSMDLSPKIIITFANLARFDLSVFKGYVEANANFSTIVVEDDLSKTVATNIFKNWQTLKLLQLAFQSESRQNVLLIGDKGTAYLEILRFVAHIYTQFVEKHNIALRNEYDLAIFQAYKSLIGEGKDLSFSPITFTFNGGELQQSFIFDDSSNYHSIRSEGDEIEFRRCMLTLMPLLELDNYKTDLTTVISTVEGDFAAKWLSAFNGKCIFSGDNLYTLANPTDQGITFEDDF